MAVDAIPFWDDPPADLTTPDGKPIVWATGPTYLDNPWDVVFINGDPIPGRAVVGGAVKLSIDRKKPGGADGITLTGTGMLPGPVDIDVTLWTKEQWQFFLTMVPKIWVTPNRGEPVKAVEISHPAFDTWGINRVIIESVGVPKAGPQPQTMVVPIRCQQFLPPSKKNRTKTVKAPAPQFPPGDPRYNALKAPSETDTGPTGPKH